MVKKIIAILAGLFAGFIGISIVQYFSSQMHPMPESVDQQNMETMKDWVASLPTSALLMVLASYALGAFAAGLVAAKIDPPCWKFSGVILGLFLLVMSIMNLTMLPHPAWMWIAPLICFVFAILGAYLFRPKSV